MYTGDTVIDGMQVQERTTRTCLLNWASGGGLDTNCLSDIWSTREYVYQLGDIVFSKVEGFSPGWDTLYYLGTPGNRWWPAHYPYPLDCGTFGMLEIQDTGHVVIDGVNLQTWDLAYLDSAGTSTWGNQQFLGADTLAIIERIGGLFPSYTCEPVDQPAFRLRHYSDWQMTTGGGLACDIVLPTSETARQLPTLVPNPGVNQFLIGGMIDAALVEVRDVLGRVIYSEKRRPNAWIDSSGWPPGTYFVIVGEANERRKTLRWVRQ